MWRHSRHLIRAPGIVIQVTKFVKGFVSLITKREERQLRSRLTVSPEHLRSNDPNVT